MLLLLLLLLLLININNNIIGNNIIGEHWLLGYEEDPVQVFVDGCGRQQQELVVVAV